MADMLDPELKAVLRAESEETKDEPYPDGTVGERPNLSGSTPRPDAEGSEGTN